ncbi:toxin HipA (plasmid) [Fulvitalea axinellae]|uniref:Toxin HipA n=1 Tax=Fulvitalea axinellae TaxID=1182444 RepID=A0AAU9CV24_9BACT|nr:toxin HipA [Fulvitalea axinellae]
MVSATVTFRGTPAGTLLRRDDGAFEFRYLPDWLRDPEAPPVSLTLPKRPEAYESPHLFPFFFNMLPEGENKTAVCRSLRIDENDDFALLLAVAHHDTIGAVCVIQNPDR